jgi:hypothetical protein
MHYTTLHTAQMTTMPETTFPRYSAGTVDGNHKHHPMPGSKGIVHIQNDTSIHTKVPYRRRAQKGS